MKQQQKVFCVVSHTHWDREWYAPLEVFRQRLVDLVDHLLVILQEQPSFVFHMDAQTVVLEDYLAVRPEKRALLRQFIQQRRMVVGPWYLENDFYLTSGEATVRNLLEGDKLCAEFGAKGQIGYAPDQFGNISQLPQILHDFGLDNFVFGRGFSEYEPDGNGGMARKPSPTEFIWEGADGTRLLAIHMRHWYNNAQRFSADSERALKFLQSIEKNYANEWTFTPYLLLMNGVDHLEPQGDLLPILDKLQQKLPAGQAILQYHMDDYVRDVQQYIDRHQVALPVHKGELRRGADREILKGTLSSRHYLKVANVRAQALLENRLEPLYCMMERAGMRGVTPTDHLRYMWKNLMRNHPHDSICGCSRDEVHRHMENRYEEFFEFGDELLHRAMQAAADHTAASRKGRQDEYVLTVANTLAFPLTGAVQADLTFLASDGFDNFVITDADGQHTPFTVLDAQEERFDVFSPINLPGTLDVKRYTALVDVGRVEPYAFKTFTLRNAPGVVTVSPAPQHESCELKNEYMSIAIAPDGKVDLTMNGRTVRDCVHLEDRADRGDSYCFVRGGDQPLLADDCVTRVRLTENTPLRQTAEIVYDFVLPETYDFERSARSEKTVSNPVTLTISLTKGEPFARVAYKVQNNACWHRLRLLVQTDIASAVSTADIPFDVVTHGDDFHFAQTETKTLANTSFATLQNETAGFGVLTEGAHEYEHMNGSCLAFTLVRATGGINASPSRQWKTPGGQCLRTIEGRVALAPYAGTWEEADLPGMAQAFRAPLLAVCTCCDTRKFTGGRPCVQDSELAELFYVPDAYEQVAMESDRSAIQINGRGVMVTAFKKAENGSGLVLRALNYTEETTTLQVTAAGKIFCTTMAEKARHYAGRDQLTLAVAPKQIVTLLLE